MSYLKEHPMFASPLITNERLSDKNTIPGTIRKPVNFLNFLKRAIMYLKHKVFLQPTTKSKEEKRECISPLRIQCELNYEQFIDNTSIKFALSRLGMLLFTLKAKNIKKYKPLVKVLDFLTMVVSHSVRFALYKDPYPDFKKLKQVKMLLQLACLDPTVAFKPLEAIARNIIITSGNLTPSEVYSKLLETPFKTIKSFTLDPQFKNAFCPLVVSKANDNVICIAKDVDTADGETRLEGRIGDTEKLRGSFSGSCASAARRDYLRLRRLLEHKDCAGPLVLHGRRQAAAGAKINLRCNPFGLRHNGGRPADVKVDVRTVLRVVQSGKRRDSVHNRARSSRGSDQLFKRIQPLHCVLRRAHPMPPQLSREHANGVHAESEEAK
eukprot:TRINITY_DN12409_c0_g2_i1.p1 TRINITY_DN12409_c0_g2~~TRINITY_DN12409_c0_g2_i1.p1  ORF type:complete len:381 (+),score=50.77 TRINITY_DN12409_c0_g2_i1:1065-2207(+)